MDGTEQKRPKRRDRGLVVVVTAALVYTAVAFTLSAMQYASLRVPHGDTGMYEEHLWNLSHGKGLRSELDDGRLFLGEHFEFIHVFLLPVYALYSSLLTLNFVESAALASGSIAILLLARKLGIEGAAVPLALSWLLYFPLQYLDFEITWKTFRPESFGVPLILFALLALESKRYVAAIGLLMVAFTAKEEFVVVGASIGGYLVLRNCWPGRSLREMGVGAALALGSALLLAWIVLWFIPYFRGGAAHYTAYFQSLGESPTEIVTSLAREPRVVVERLGRPGVLWLLVLLLGPLAFIPVASPLRLAVAGPTLCYLGLSDRPELIEPWFHFHGPLIPVVYWSLVGGVANLRRVVPVRVSGWLVFGLCALSGFGLGRSPLSWRFYDASMGSERRMEWDVSVRPDWQVPIFVPEGDYWRSVYLPDARSEAFGRALAHVRRSDRVAATHYLRSRFTHYRAAHDYPTFRKHVTIDDIDVIVLDKTEGYWGRGPTNPDQELLRAMFFARPAGTQVMIRGRLFEIVYHDPYFLVVRRVGG